MRPRLRIVNVQVIVAPRPDRAWGRSHSSTRSGHVASALGVSEVLLALVVAPIATELPEKFNSIIWIRQGKDTLAMGNITGAMVFQAAIPTIVALRLRAASVGGRAGALCSRSPRRGSPSSPARRSSCRCTAPGRLRGRGLLVGGLFYVAYLGDRASAGMPARLHVNLRPGAPAGGTRDILAPQFRTSPRPRREPPRSPSRCSPRRRRTPAAEPEQPTAPPPRSTTSICYFEGDYVPLRDAKVSIMTHAFMYGTAVFEGIRAYWNADQGELYGLKLREHMERHPPERGDPADDGPAAGRRARPDRGRDDPPQRLRARTPTSGRASTSPAGRSACACTTCPTS